MSDLFDIEITDRALFIDLYIYKDYPCWSLGIDVNGFYWCGRRAKGRFDWRQGWRRTIRVISDE